MWIGKRNLAGDVCIPDTPNSGVFCAVGLNPRVATRSTAITSRVMDLRSLALMG
jgi:hypothetical protein